MDSLCPGVAENAQGALVAASLALPVRPSVVVHKTSLTAASHTPQTKFSVVAFGGGLVGTMSLAEQRRRLESRARQRAIQKAIERKASSTATVRHSQPRRLALNVSAPYACTDGRGLTSFTVRRDPP